MQRSISSNKHFVVLIVSCLLASAIGSPRQKPSENNPKQIQQDESTHSNQNDNSHQGKPRSKREVDFLLPEDDVLDVELDGEANMIKKLGFDGSLLRVKRQGGGWRNHDWNDEDDSSSDGSSSSDDSSTDTSDDSTDSSSDSDSDGDTDSSSGSSSGSESTDSDSTSDDSSDSSSDSDSDGDTDSSSDSSSGSDDDDHHHHHHHHRQRWNRGGWGHGGGWGR